MANAVILPLIQLCASSVIAMGIAGKLLNEHEYMLIVSAQRCPDLKGRFVGFSVMGDGLSLALVAKGPGTVTIGRWSAYNCGDTSFNKMNCGAVSQKSTLNLQRSIIGNGIAFLERSLADMGCRLDDIAAFIHPNTNYDVWNKIYPQLLNTTGDLFYTDNISDGGHINDVDLVRNLKDYLLGAHARRPLMVMVYAIDLGESFDINYHLLLLESK
jgi:hypothetical protein